MNILYILFPKSRVCAVSYTNNCIPKIQNKIVVDSVSPDDEIFDHAGISSMVEIKPKSLLFAHPDEAFLNIQLQESNVLKPKWFSNNEFKLVFACICSGSILLNRPKWKGVFNDWVSFNGTIYTEESNPNFKKTFNRFIRKTHKHLLNSDNSMRFVNKTKAQLDIQLNELAESPINDQLVTKIILEMYLDKMVNKTSFQ